MTFVSWYFLFGFVIVATLYYIFPIKYRWVVLLASSILFYLRSGFHMLICVLISSLFTWLIGLVLSVAKIDHKRKKRLFITWLGILILALNLMFTKIISHFEITVNWFINPIGISYYTFSSIGYIADIYWKKEEAEKSPLKFILFILYFPKIMQGPIEKHRELAPKLIEGHRISYQNITYGIQLMLWGFFKKLVVANRAATYVNAVHGDIDNYLGQGGIYILWISILSVVELYFDFSGYVDIATGISQVFGIQLSKNFNHPFFSKSAAEFWRRWHMTLGMWFKDYVYMPLSANARLIRIGGKIKERHGRRAARNFMTVIPLTVVWILTGLWHGTGLNYIVWGLYWGTIIIVSTTFSPELVKLCSMLHINVKSTAWSIVQVVRTSIIYLVARIISSFDTLKDSFLIMKTIFTDFHVVKAVEVFKGFSFVELSDYLIIAMGVVLVFVISLCEERRGDIREIISSWWAIPRWIVYSLMVLVPLYLGLYGAGSSDTSSFAYIFY